MTLKNAKTRELFQSGKSLHKKISKSLIDGTFINPGDSSSTKKLNYYDLLKKTITTDNGAILFKFHVSFFIKTIKGVLVAKIEFSR